MAAHFGPRAGQQPEEEGQAEQAQKRDGNEGDLDITDAEPGRRSAAEG